MLIISFILHVSQVLWPCFGRFSVQGAFHHWQAHSACNHHRRSPGGGRIRIP